jgi:streptomycin 3"-adenylyltransferase
VGGGPGRIAALEGYPAAVAAGLARVLGPALVGVYLHGSAALGGWSAERSDVDLLGVVARPLERRAKREISARLNHPSLACPAAAGLELSMVTAAVAADPPRRPPFELHVTTGPSAQTHLGGPAAADPDLLLHFAVCRRAGVAVAGPGPVEVFAEPPRAWLLERAAAELRWAVRHGTFAYRVLTACRAWRYLEDDVLGSKVESGRWARVRLAGERSAEGAASDPPGAGALVDAAVAAQLGHAPAPGAPADLAAADRFVATVLDRFGEQQG